MLKYGTVIQFGYASATVIAMVVVPSTDRDLISDEGTAMNAATTNRVMVFGLDRVGTSIALDKFHKPGITATFDAYPGDYKVLG